MLRKIRFPALCSLLLASGCGAPKTENETISKSYIHKYGYAVSQEEWDARQYPGQVIEVLKNGVTITATYENGNLHGPYTITYPHSQIVEKYILYNTGSPVKEVSYDVSGMPTEETIRLSSDRHTVTAWYTDGVPKSVEEFQGEELREGTYFAKNHEKESSIVRGNGTRILRDREGTLLCKDTFEEGFMTERNAFYPSGSPESISYYSENRLHGTRKTFTPAGEPLAVEDWANGHLHGLCTYYKNGAKELEVYYLYGQKHGSETHFLDGESVMHQVSWERGQKHGPETFFLAEGPKLTWNYEGKEVSRSRFEELTRIDALMSEPAE